MAINTLRRCGLLGLLAICNALSTSAQVPSQSEDGLVRQWKLGQRRVRSEAETSDAGVDLRPVFREMGLSTRAQGTRGTCSVFTVTRSIEYALGKQERRGSRLSVEFLNWASNRAIRERGDGGFFSDLWKGFERYGICNEEEMAYRAEFDPRSRPSYGALTQAGHVRDAGLQLHWIKPWDPNRGLNDEQFTAVKETLRNEWPVCGGFLWPKKPVWDDKVLQMASRENVRDGHSVLLVGFRDNSSLPGGGVFLIQNTSKGPRDGSMSYEYVRAYMNDAAWIGCEGD